MGHASGNSDQLTTPPSDLERLEGVGLGLDPLHAELLDLGEELGLGGELGLRPRAELVGVELGDNLVVLAITADDALDGDDAVDQP